MQNGVKRLFRQIRTYWAIKRSGLFDREYYLRNNLSVARSCMNPIKHYIRHGWREGRNPSPLFDTNRYLQQNSDVEKSRINPLYHYIKHSISKNLNLSSSFSTGDHLADEGNVTITSDDSLTYLPVSNQYKYTNNASWCYRTSEEELLDQVRKYNAQKNKRKAKVVVYTAIIGDYDQLILPEYIIDNWDYVLFSDIDIPGEHIFKVRRPDYYNINPTRTARYIKTHPHVYFSEYEYSVWIDSNIMIRGPHLEKSLKYCSEHDILLMANPHPDRNCVYQELEKCIELKKDDQATMQNQVALYKKEGLPEMCGMLETNIFIRKHNDIRVKNFNEAWWKEIEKGSYRDQLSVMYVLWKQRLHYEVLPDMKDVRKDGNDYRLFVHFRAIATKLPIYFQPPFMRQSERKTNQFSLSDLTPLHNESIDIVVCVHNALQDVNRCLKSVLANLLPTHRLIVVDDGSDADTNAFLNKLAHEHRKQLLLIRNDQAKGYTKAANMGLKASDASLVILLNSDTIVPKNWAVKMLQTARSFPDIGVVGPMSNAASWQSVPQIKDPQSGRFAINELPKGQTVEDMDKLCEKNGYFSHFPRVPLINGFCYGINRQVLDTIGYFDEDAFPRGYGVEDDFSMRALDAGFMHAIATHCYVYHAKSKSFGSAKRDKLSKAGGEVLRARHGEWRINRATQSMANNPMLWKVRYGVTADTGNTKVPPKPLSKKQETLSVSEPVVNVTKTKTDKSSKNVQPKARHIISAEAIQQIQSLKSLIADESIEFFDFGCSHGSGVLWTQKNSGKIGLGFDIDRKKLEMAAGKGILCTQYDILKLPDEKLVPFTTIYHMLEHLDSLDLARKFIQKACMVSRKNVFIRQPYFDADTWLAEHGLKTYYSDWTGHKNLMTTSDLRCILYDLRRQGVIKDFAIGYYRPIKDSDSQYIHPIESPKDSHEYDPKKHPPKPAKINFEYPVFYEIILSLDIDGSGLCDLWYKRNPDTVVFDSKDKKCENPFESKQGRLKKNRDKLEIKSFYRSRSWKITAPARNMFRLLRSTKHLIKTKLPNADSQNRPVASEVQVQQVRNPTSHQNHTLFGKERVKLKKIQQYNVQKSKRKAKVVVYTAITNNYDTLILPEYITNDWDYVCFSDVDIPGENIFEIRKTDFRDADHSRIVRYVKTHPHKYFPDYEYSVWIDANILIRGPHLENSVKDCIKRSVLYMGCPHPEKREGIYDELAACITLKKDDPTIMVEQVTRYIKEGFPERLKMLAGGLIIRKHSDPRVMAAGESWWSEIVQGSCRDQLSLMYVLWKQGLDYEVLPNLENLREHSDYYIFPHANKFCLGKKQMRNKKECNYKPLPPKTRKICRDQMRINYFDMGLCDGEEMEWMVDSILPSLGIENYRAYGFEPCQVFYDNLKSKFGNNDKVTLIKKAISDKNGIAKLYYSWESKEGHSIFDTKNNVSKDTFETVETVLFSDWLREKVPDFAESFNILRFNIEGAEWHLINDLVKNDMIKNIDIFCGHGDDVKKIGEYKDNVDEYYNTLKRHNIKILLFCSIYPETKESLKKMIQTELALKKARKGR